MGEASCDEAGGLGIEMNEIANKQNEDGLLALLRARRRIYGAAKMFQGTAVLGTLALPVISLAAAAFIPQAKLYIAAIALFFGVVDLVVIDRLQKGWMKVAAKLQESFDCEVLSMDPNEFLVGASVDPEEAFRWYSAKLTDEDEKRLRDWYPVAVARLPLHVGRILCQRENLLYDGNVRRFYGRLLQVGVLVVLACLFGYTIASGQSMANLLLTVFIPAMPAVNWALREFFRQRDTIETLERLKSESEKLWKKAIQGIDETEAAERSRELQDAIYTHRVSSPLVFDFLYLFRRNDLEAQMNAGADHFVGEYLKKSPTPA
jgi:SMODS-associating 4TM effector domain